MAESDKIKSSEIIEKDLFADPTKSAKKLYDSLVLLEEQFKAIIEVQSKIAKESGKKMDYASIQKTAAAIDKHTQAYEGLITVQKTKAELTEKELALNELEKKARRERINLEKAEIILLDKNRGAIEKLNAANLKLRIQRDAIIGTDKKAQAEIKKLNKLIDINNAQIIKQSDQLKKAKLNVGNYSASIRAALAETGAFDNGIVRMIVTLRNLVTNLQAGKEGASKLGLALKAVSALGIVAIIAGLTSALKANQSVMDKLSVIWNDFLDLSTRHMTSFGDAERATQALRKEMRLLSIELQLLTLDEEDFKEISNDNTLGFKERDAALQKSFEFRKKIADKSVEIAQKEFDVAQKNVLAGAGIGVVSNEKLDARNEAQIKLNKALDDQNDLERILGAEARKRRDTELIIDLELVRSKKKSSTAQIDILEKQLQDEKLQIEERETALKQFNDANRATFDEQIRLIKTKLGVEFDANELLKEQNNIALAEKIKGLQLGEEVTAALAAIIKKSQDAEIKGLNESSKLEDEKIKRLQRIQQIQRDIAKAKREDAINDLELQQREFEFQSQKLKNDAELNPFKRSTRGELKQNLSDQEIILKDIAQKKAENLEKQKKDDEANAKATISDKKVLDAELLKIEEQYQIDIANLEAESAQNSKELAQQNADFLINLEKQKSAAILNELGKITSATGDEIDKRSEKQQKAYDSDIAKREESLSRQEELAAKGLDNQLAFEKASLAKKELEQKQALEKAQKQKEAAQMVEAYFSAFNAELQQPGATPQGAAGRALADVFLAKGIAKGLVQFAAEGNDMIEGPGTTTSDSIPFMLSKKEAVIKASENIKHNDAVKALNAGKFDEMYMPKLQYADAVNSMKSKSVEQMANEMLAHEFRKQTEILKRIENKPIQQVDVDKFGNLIETVYTTGVKAVTVHKNSRARL